VFFHALVAMEIGIVIFLIFLLCLVPWIFKSQNDVETAHTAEEKIKALEKRIKALEGQSNNQNDNSQLIKPF
jgi:competence protein ComGC